MKQTKGVIQQLWGTRSARINDFLSLLERNPSVSLIDLGCYKGELASKWAQRIGTNKVAAVEMIEEFAKKAEEKGIKVIKADLNEGIPVPDNSFDVVTSDQVIEHLINIDLFVKEIYRILKPGGYAVISTENLSAWHNIFALILGFRPFSLDYSTEIAIGNPLSTRNKKEIKCESGTPHVKVLTYRSLKELFEIYGFKVEKIIGTGYYPFPKQFQRPFSRIDPRHAHYLTVKVRK
jgi:ubiquinone/menaquinone biosynthesis C-methylase UbiE